MSSNFFIFHNIPSVNEFSRNESTKTKGIATTLFISSSVLAGLMAMGIGLPQTASADPPTCPENTVERQGNTCIGPAPTTEAGCEDPDQHVTGGPDPHCAGGGTGPTDVIQITTCEDPFEPGTGRFEGQCVAERTRPG